MSTERTDQGQAGLEQTLSLEQATREYKNNPNSPECLTQFMRSFWAEAGQRIGKTFTVDKFPLTAKEIKERQEEGHMAIFVPDGVTKFDLERERMFPEMRNMAVGVRYSAVNVVNNSGWLWVEASVDSPNRNTIEDELEEKFKKENKQGQSLRSYLVGSQISKLLTNEYFDEGTWSRLLGSRHEGCVVRVHFFSGGGWYIVSGPVPGLRHKDLGGRSEEVADGLNAEWERQVKRYIELGFHKELNLSEKEYHDSLPKFTPQPEAYKGRFDIPVLVETRIPVSKQAECAGVFYLLDDPEVVGVWDWKYDPKGYKTPETPYITWMQDGRNYLNESVIKVRTAIVEDERGATEFDGIALFIKDPEVLKHHFIDLPGTSVELPASPNSELSYYLNLPEFIRGTTRAPCLELWCGPRLAQSCVDSSNPRFGSASCGR